jgi:flagellar hook-length control protein FliK
VQASTQPQTAQQAPATKATAPAGQQSQGAPTATAATATATATATSQASTSNTPQGDTPDQQTAAQPQQAPAPSHQNTASAQATPATAQPTASAAQTAAAQTPQPAQPAQAAPATPAAALPTRYGVSLSDAVEQVRATVEMGASQGATTAKIELSPGSLGTITIQLQHTDDGVTAKVLADHAATADTLSQSGDDLRRALQSAGVNLLSLDIGTRGDNSAQAQNQNAGQSSGSTHTASTDTADTTNGDAAPIEPTTSLPAGSALVNVLA